jgi:hypothetical protein
MPNTHTNYYKSPKNANLDTEAAEPITPAKTALLGGICLFRRKYRSAMETAKKPQLFGLH